MTDAEIRALAIEQGDETELGFMFNKEGQWALFKFARAVERATYARVLEMIEAAAKEWSGRCLVQEALGARAFGDRVRSLMMQEQPK